MQHRRVQVRVLAYRGRSNGVETSTGLMELFSHGESDTCSLRNISYHSQQHFDIGPCPLGFLAEEERLFHRRVMETMRL